MVGFNIRQINKMVEYPTFPLPLPFMNSNNSNAYDTANLAGYNYISTTYWSYVVIL